MLKSIDLSLNKFLKSKINFRFWRWSGPKNSIFSEKFDFSQKSLLSQKSRFFTKKSIFHRKVFYHKVKVHIINFFNFLLCKRDMLLDLRVAKLVKFMQKHILGSYVHLSTFETWTNRTNRTKRTTKIL